MEHLKLQQGKKEKPIAIEDDHISIIELNTSSLDKREDEGDEHKTV